MKLALEAQWKNNTDPWEGGRFDQLRIAGYCTEISDRGDMLSWQVSYADPFNVFGVIGSGVTEPDSWDVARARAEAFILEHVGNV